jgi:hypothetical protein
VYFQLFQGSNPDETDPFVWDTPLWCPDDYYVYRARIAYKYYSLPASDDIGMFWLQFFCKNPQTGDEASEIESDTHGINTGVTWSNPVDTGYKYLCPCGAFTTGKHWNADVGSDDFGLGHLALCFCAYDC